MSVTEKRDAVAAFWEKVQRGGEDDCWPWTGATNGSGYGYVTVDGRSFGAHVFAKIVSGSPRPGRREIDHSCFMRICCNPKHMRWVTHAENMRRSANARKTHCHRGHAFTPENTIRKPTGRECRTCRNEKKRKPVPTTCSNGHPRTPENYRVYGGTLRCVPCHVARVAAARKS